MSTHSDELRAVTSQLEQVGYDVTQLRELQEELEAIEQPPGFVRRMTRQLKETAAHQWRLLVGELEESREAFALVKSTLAGRSLTQEERDKVRSQMFDLVRLFPAGLIAAANSAFPVPGTGLLTPWILRRMGLLPSRWREAHVLGELQRQHEKLEREGNHEAAERILQIEHELEEEAQRREQVAKRVQLLTHWDKNQNGVWDPEERAAYEAEIERLRAALPTTRSRKAWFFSYEREVFGPLRLSEIDPNDHGESLLCCFDGKSGWVAVDDLLVTTEHPPPAK